MGAYSLVDNGVRKKLDEMLKTWKQPVPHSLDSRPVFDPSITKRIENALIQAKTRTLQVEQQQQREQQELLRRRTPSSLPPNQWRVIPSHSVSGAEFDQRQPRDQQEMLRRLAAGTHSEAWRNTPTPPQIGTETQQLQQREQQDMLHRQLPSTPPYTQWRSTPDSSYKDGTFMYPTPSSQGFVNYQPTPAPAPAPALAPVPASISGPSQLNLPLADLASLLRSSLAGKPASASNTFSGSLRSPLSEKSSNIELTSASLKIDRPQLIDKLYNEQPNQCLTCGQRFEGTGEGRSKKAHHMDWHFRTNQRLTYDAQRGQSRSWYLDELDWIKFRVSDDGTQDADEHGLNQTSSATAVPSNEPRNKFIPVPSENELPCGICQDKFAPSWNEQLQDFVWMDAVRVGNRIYHASCYADFQKDEANTLGRVSTPNSILGKRKAKVRTPLQREY